MLRGGEGAGVKVLRNRSEQGSRLLLSGRLAHFNRGQAFTVTEDGFGVFISGCVCVRGVSV